LLSILELSPKNYLEEDELIDLNLIVDQYLSFAELQARNRKPMYMKDWKERLSVFLKANDREILHHAGKISAKMAKELAESEYTKFREKRIKDTDTNEMKALELGIKKIKPKSKS
jgi:hypothetical protein